MFTAHKGFHWFFSVLEVIRVCIIYKVEHFVFAEKSTFIFKSIKTVIPPLAYKMNWIAFSAAKAIIVYYVNSWLVLTVKIIC